MDSKQTIAYAVLVGSFMTAMIGYVIGDKGIMEVGCYGVLVGLAACMATG